MTPKVTARETLDCPKLPPLTPEMKMTRFAKTLILAALLAGPTAALAETYSGTVTGSNGGTVTYSGECVAGDAKVTCTRKSLLTGPNGKTATRDMERVWTKDKVTTKFVTTGEGGGTVTSFRERLR